jgi:DNA-binding MarR family transcriptional regulator
MNYGSFDELIHAPNRLMIRAILELVDEMEFALLKDKLAVSKSVLSKQLKLLADANYLEINKATQNGRQRTWLSLTEEGTEAYKEHVKALKSTKKHCRVKLLHHRCQTHDLHSKVNY